MADSRLVLEVYEGEDVSKDETIQVWYVVGLEEERDDAGGWSYVEDSEMPYGSFLADPERKGLRDALAQAVSEIREGSFDLFRVKFPIGGTVEIPLAAGTIATTPRNPKEGFVAGALLASGAMPTPQDEQRL